MSVKNVEFPLPVKIEEDQKPFIDLDSEGNSPEDIVIEWHLEMRRFFGGYSAASGEDMLVSIMKKYITSITERAINFEDVVRLHEMVEQHMQHIFWFFRDSDTCFSDVYLDHMEHILTFYVNLTLRVLLVLKRKIKVTQKRVLDMTQKVAKRLSFYLLKSEYHIFHVLIRQTTTLVDGMIKDVMNVLNSNICKQMFRNLYMHFLVLTPVKDMSDEAFCRAFILFENWKAFEDNKQNDKIDECLKNIFNRDMNSIKNNEFLSRILSPRTSIMSDLMKVMGCDPSITKAYFDYIKSKQKVDKEMLDDIGKLALEDAVLSETELLEEEDDDADYLELFEQIMGNTSYDLNEVVLDCKNERSVAEMPSTREETEILVLDTDSDSDVEIVSITPSQNIHRLSAPTNKSRNPSARTRPVTSFLESISVDVDTARRKSGFRTFGNLNTKTSEANHTSTAPPPSISEEGTCLILDDDDDETSRVTDAEKDQQVTENLNNVDTGKKENQQTNNTAEKDQQITEESVNNVDTSVKENQKTNSSTANKDQQITESVINVDTSEKENQKTNSSTAKEDQQITESVINVDISEKEIQHTNYNPEQAETEDSTTSADNILGDVPTEHHQLMEVSEILSESNIQTPEENVHIAEFLETPTILSVNPDEREITPNEAAKEIDSVNPNDKEIAPKEAAKEVDSVNPNDKEITPDETAEEIDSQILPETQNPHETLSPPEAPQIPNTPSPIPNGNNVEIEISASSLKLAETVKVLVERIPLLEDVLNSALETEKTVAQEIIVNSGKPESEMNHVQTVTELDIAEKIGSLRIIPSIGSSSGEYEISKDSIESVCNEGDVLMSRVENESLVCSNSKETCEQLGVQLNTLCIESDQTEHFAQDVKASTISDTSTSEKVMNSIRAENTIGCGDCNRTLQSGEVIEILNPNKESEVSKCRTAIEECENVKKVNPPCPETNVDEPVVTDDQSEEISLLDTGQDPFVVPLDTGQFDPNSPASPETLDISLKPPNMKGEEQKMLRTVSDPLIRKGQQQHGEFGCYPTPPGSEEEREKDSDEPSHLVYILPTKPFGFDETQDKHDYEAESVPELNYGALTPSNVPSDDFLCAEVEVGSTEESTAAVGLVGRPTCEEKEEGLGTNPSLGESTNSSGKSPKRVRINETPEMHIIPASDEYDMWENNTDYDSSSSSDNEDSNPSRLKLKQKLSPIPFSKYITKRNGGSTCIPLSGRFSPEKPPTLKGMLKRIDESRDVHDYEAEPVLGLSFEASTPSNLTSDDFLCAEVEVGSTEESSAVVGLVGRLSCEEKEETLGTNPSLGKSYEQIVKDAVGHNSTEDEDETLIPPKKDNQGHSDDDGHISFDEMEQFLKNCDNEDYTHTKHKRRKRAREKPPDDPRSRKNSSVKPPKRVKINDTPETHFITSYDEDIWEQNSDSDNDDCSSSKPKVKRRPSPMPLSKYLTKRNGGSTRIPLSGRFGPEKPPPLKGILKCIEQKHPVDDEPETVVILLHQRELGRGKRGSVEVKVYPKSFITYKIPFDDRKLCEHRACVELDQIRAGDDSVWARVSDRMWEHEDETGIQPDKPMYKIVFDKKTPQLNSNDRKYYCDPSISSSDSTKHKSTVFESDHKQGVKKEKSLVRRSKKNHPDNTAKSTKKGRNSKISVISDLPVAPKKQKEVSPKYSYPALGTLEEALITYANFYRKEEEDALIENFANKAKNLRRIVNRFDQAIKNHRLGKLVDIDKLPVPPGYPPFQQSNWASYSDNSGTNLSQKWLTRENDNKNHVSIFSEEEHEQDIKRRKIEKVRKSCRPLIIPKYLKDYT